MRLVFSIGLLLVPIALLAEDFKTLTFYTDDTEQNVSLPDSSCLAFLDDTSNYKFEIEPNSQLRVIALGVSDRSATLLIDCPDRSLVYSLEFKSRSRHSLSDIGSKVLRPNSSVGLSVFHRGADVRSYDVEISDRSLDQLQLTVRKSHQNNFGAIIASDSADVLHQFGEHYLGYGHQRTIGPKQNDMLFRFNGGLLGFSLSHSRSIYMDRDGWQDITWFRTPQPLGLGYGREEASTGKVSHTFDRYMSVSAGSFGLGIVTRYQWRKDELGSTEGRYNVRAEGTFRPFNVLRLANFNSLSCPHHKGCLIDQWILKSFFTYARTELSLEYGLLPHMITTGFNAEAFGRQRLSVKISRTLQRKSFVSRFRQFAKDGLPDTFSESTGGHIEVRGDRWTYFWDQSASILQRKLWSNTLGVRYDGDQIVAGVGASFEGKKVRQSSFIGNLRYFFSDNLRSISQKLVKRLIKVNVRSNAPGAAVVDGNMELLQNGQLLVSRQLQGDGVTEFFEAKCCGDYELRFVNGTEEVRQGVFVSEVWQEKSVTLTLSDHREMLVDFVVQAPNGSFEAVALNNHISELSESIVSCDGCRYANNYVYVSRRSNVKLLINESLLPFSYQFGGFDHEAVDGAIKDRGRIKVILRGRGQ